MRKYLLPPLLALVGGAAGLALRRWQLAAGFEPDTGLAIPGSPTALALMALSAGVALAIFLLILGAKERLPWGRAFGAGRHNTVFLTLLLLSAILLLGSAGAEAMEYTAGGLVVSYAGENQVARMAGLVLPPLRILLSLMGAFCVFLWGREIYTAGDRGRENLCILELCLLYCVWLISDYQTRAADPVMQDYLYEVLAIAFSLLGLYFLAGYSFQTGKPRRCVFFCLMGAYFSLVTLADGHALADLFRCGFAVLFLTAHAAVLLNPPDAQALPAEEETEADENA